MKIDQLKPGFGAVVTDVDIPSLSDTEWGALQGAFHAGGGLLLVRLGEHKLTAAQLKGFAARFGTLEDNEKYYRMGTQNWLHSEAHREILCVGNKLGDRSMMIKVDPKAPLLWHTDDSFRNPQPMGSCFYCVEPPADNGAATCFASGTSALRALPKAVREELSGFAAVHDYDHLNEVLRRDNPTRAPLSDAVKAATPPLLRPLIAKHPNTGADALYVPSCHIAKVVRLDGTPAVLSDATQKAVAAAATDEVVGGAHSTGFSGTEEVVAPLLRLITSEPHAYRHEWRAGDLLVWDNRCTLHAPTAFDDSRNTRLMWRITIFGDQITPPPEALQAALDETAGGAASRL